MATSAVEQPRIDLVGHDCHMWMGLKPLNQLGNFLTRGDAASRVGRAVDNDQTRVGCDLLQNFLSVKGKAVCLFECNRHRGRARIADH